MDNNTPLPEMRRSKRLGGRSYYLDSISSAPIAGIPCFSHDEINLLNSNNDYISDLDLKRIFDYKSEVVDNAISYIELHINIPDDTKKKDKNELKLHYQKEQIKRIKQEIMSRGIKVKDPRRDK